MTDNRELNRENFKQFMRERPLATHGMWRTSDDRLVDIPLTQTDSTITNRPTWLLESLAGGTVEFAPDSLAEQDIEVPPKPSEIGVGTAPADSSGGDDTGPSSAVSTPVPAPKKKTDSTGSPRAPRKSVKK